MVLMVFLSQSVRYVDSSQLAVHSLVIIELRTLCFNKVEIRFHWPFLYLHYVNILLHLGRVVDWAIDSLKTASGASGLELDSEALQFDSEVDEEEIIMEV